MLKTTSPEQMIVRDAAYWLDAEVPGWAHRVDVGVLDISCASTCVMEQVFRRPWALGMRWDARGAGYLRGMNRLPAGSSFRVAFASDNYRPAWIEAIQMRCDGAWGA